MLTLFAFQSLQPQEWGILAAAFLAIAVGAFFLGKRTKPETEPVTAAPLPSQTSKTPRAEADVIHFLALLQEKGRLVDFLMDDVTSYDDAQVGAAARVVHQGCQSVLQEHLSITPIAAEAEGTAVSLPAGYAAADYRLLGNVSGEPPYEGTLVHQGWRAGKVTLPQTVNQDDDRLPNIAAAQVELY